MRKPASSNDAGLSTPEHSSSAATWLNVAANLLGLLVITTFWEMRAPASCGALLMRLMPGLG